MDNIDRIYLIAHPNHEKERIERVVKQFKTYQFPLQKITAGAATWGTDITPQIMYSVWDPFMRVGIPNYSWKSRFLSKGEISLVLNFYAVIRDAIQKKYKYVIIFESDVFLRPDFIPRFNDLWQDLSGNWDYVSLGEGIGTRPKDVPPSYWSPTKAYKPPHDCVFRCTDSMLFRVSFLEKVFKTLIPFRECLDWELNFQLAVHKGIAYWCDPPLAEQGSGRFRDISLLPA
jgi:hypothetical protein